MTAILITYNQAPYVGQALESVLTQQFDEPWEIVIADDASTDGTDRVLDQTLARIETSAVVKRLPAEQNLGMQENLRRSISAAQGEFVALLEGDDCWTDTAKLEKQVGVIRCDKTIAAVGHACGVIEPGSDYELSDRVQALAPRRYGLDDVLVRRFPHTSTLMFRREYLRTTPSWLDGLWMGDWPVSSLLALRGDLLVESQCMSAYRLGVGIHSTATELVKWERTLDCCRAICGNLDLTAASRRRALSRVLFEYGVAAAKQKKYTLALRLLAECAVNKPSVLWQAPSRSVRW